MQGHSDRLRQVFRGGVYLWLALPMFSGYASDAGWERQRSAALNRPREVIYNNDGDEPLIWPKKEPFSLEAFFGMRTAAVADSQVDTVFYCPGTPFGLFKADIPSAELFLRNLSYKYRNVMPEFLKRGTDPVREIEKWCKAHTKEFFVTVRVNDTHDGNTDQARLGPPYDASNVMFSAFKAAHPELLMGASSNRPPFCVWSAADFTHAAVREKFYQTCRELCAKYDLDGLDLDFFRHMQLFKSVAWGGTASEAERQLMTELMRRVRAAAEEEGRRRGRPILLSVRVPDSVPYCREVGIDLEAWLREGLVDMVAATGYWQHNPWQVTAELCRRHNVKCYASLDESRVPETADTPLKRKTCETYRARAMAARQAGMDGILYFNLFRPAQIKDFMWGSPERMRLHDKCYFVTYRGGRMGGSNKARSYLKGAERHFSLQELTPATPVRITPGKSFLLSVWIGDDPVTLAREKLRPQCLLLVDGTVPEGAELAVSINGQAVAGERAEGTVLRYPLRLERLVCGENRLEFSAKAAKGVKPITLRDAAVQLTGFQR